MTIRAPSWYIYIFIYLYRPHRLHAPGRASLDSLPWAILIASRTSLARSGLIFVLLASIECTVGVPKESFLAILSTEGDLFKIPGELAVVELAEAVPCASIAFNSAFAFLSFRGLGLFSMLGFLSPSDSTVALCRKRLLGTAISCWNSRGIPTALEKPGPQMAAFDEAMDPSISIYISRHRCSGASARKL